MPALSAMHIPDLGPPQGAARLRPPLSDRWTRYDALAYLEASDLPSGEEHAFLAYQETSLMGAGWRVRVRSRLTAGGVFEPAAMAQQAQGATARGERSFVWGYQRLPSPADARHIEFRVHVDAGRPVRLELFARLRCADGGPAAAHSASCAWPADAALP
ncbi:hypothetical protein [Pseudorhodoferax sp.]|uniref:hypothetical protein n=1 Tax=Pseudorhodoferax sp. TaxID=1993553 RepID=UPI002DD61F57|nr:hypothetical protein [Pseudorhodoferax sp.]